MIIRKSLYIAPRDEATVGLYVFLDSREAAALARGGTVVIATDPSLPEQEIIITTGAGSPESERLADSARMAVA